MSGRYSRNKGRANEYKLRDYFRSIGWKSDRVPLSGASQGYKGDIRIEKEGKTFYAELKVRHNEFKTLYAYLEARGLSQGSVFIGPNILCSYNFETMGFSGNAEPNNSFPKTECRTYRKLEGLQKLVKDCDFLVIKIDYKPFIFIRYL